MLTSLSSANEQLSVERRNNLELKSQLSQLRIEHDMLMRRNRVDDLRLTSMSEDLSMLAENNEGLERVLKMEYDLRIQAQHDLHERNVGHADGLKVWLNPTNGSTESVLCEASPCVPMYHACE